MTTADVDQDSVVAIAIGHGLIGFGAGLVLGALALTCGLALWAWRQ